jgi:hypothetical protein
MTITPLKPLSEAIFEPLNRAYKLGGFGLAFLALGSFLMLAAFFLPARGILPYLVLFAGFVMIVLVSLLFYLKDIRPIYAAQRSVEQNSELIDVVQKTALEMTRLASNMEALAFKHSTQVHAAIQTIRKELEGIPYLSRISESKPVARTEQGALVVVDYAERAKEVIDKVQRALIESDPDCLKEYLDDLRNLSTRSQQLLRE